MGQGSKGWDRGSEGWDLGPQPWYQESQTMGSGSAVSYRDQGSGCTTFVGSGTKIGHAFGIKEQKFAYKNGISNEKNIPRYHPGKLTGRFTNKKFCRICRRRIVSYPPHPPPLLFLRKKVSFLKSNSDNLLLLESHIS